VNLEPFALLVVLSVEIGLLAVVLALLVAFYVIRPRFAKNRGAKAASMPAALADTPSET